MLQGERTHRYEAIRVRGAHRCDLFVLTLDDAAGQVSIRPVVVTGNGTDGLDVSSMFIHMPQASVHVLRLQDRRSKRAQGSRTGSAHRVVLDQVLDVNRTVAMNVDR